jgi:transcriptional regulator with XRE-family HTH domain
VSNVTTAELRLGETLRRLRLQRGLELTDVAVELGVPAKSLRALEWGRPDLLGGTGGEQIERRYAAFLGLDAGRPAPAPMPAAAPTAPVAAQPSREVSLVEWLALLAAIGPPLVIAVPFLFEDVPVLTLALVFLASLLLLGAALPQGVVSRAPLSAGGQARYRDSLGLAALGILIPVAAFNLLAALT